MAVAGFERLMERLHTSDLQIGLGCRPSLGVVAIIPRAAVRCDVVLEHLRVPDRCHVKRLALHNWEGVV